MNEPVTYELLRPGREPEVCGLIARVFQEFIGPGYAPEGVGHFLEYVQPAAMAERQTRNHIVITALCGSCIVGAIEVRDHEHVSLMFVDKEHHRRGVCRELFRRAVDHIRAAGTTPESMTVNSSPYAVPVYQRLGFTVQEPEKEINGIRFIPMKMELD